MRLSPERPSSIRELGHRDLDRAVDLRDDAQRLSVELDADEAQRGNGGIDTHAISRLREVRKRRLDALAGALHQRIEVDDGILGDKPVAECDDARLWQFIERYNVGWVVCWTPESIQRFRSLPMARPIAELKDGQAGVLFALERKPCYLLKGRAKWVQADAERIALADVEPENGEVVLSAHYQTNLRVSPAVVHSERDLDLDDPIPLIRLRVPGPVARLSIVWEVP